MTVDASAPGKREADERSRAEVEVASGISGGKIGSDSKGGGIGRSVGGFIDPKLSWKDIEWLRQHTKVAYRIEGCTNGGRCHEGSKNGCGCHLPVKPRVSIKPNCVSSGIKADDNTEDVLLMDLPLQCTHYLK